ncbi:MAG: 50S ribosomal protein L3 [Candidatus Colwellbacteria bacterium CG10_big_fil_rev_8_21_14_0_10_41_28]|uniref:Large ribosomal subunit protein uL3 n=1 Tax=Candidatus Colwellbacteria bacterium CG10_big_fil_rev_8_21_14_0_10_41_28 TaxID=1974539 RepID=A0A2H0VH54_9BACT|nr:MAG: 50S ribosomal protein L3 [Candidatus Colwellbacteria bacterium CG10_big_fil_rev_8_21_14_0_10_41_28]
MTQLEGKKIKMGQIFHEENVVPVTFVKLAEKPDFDIEIGAKVKVSGLSKGRGFQGVVKRYNFRGSPKSHGTKHTLRTGGSIGATGPQRVLPGQKMPGRMGNTKVNLKNLEIAGYEKDQGLLLIKGALPGAKGSKVSIFIK